MHSPIHCILSVELSPFTIMNFSCHFSPLLCLLSLIGVVCNALSADCLLEDTDASPLSILKKSIALFKESQLQKLPSDTDSTKTLDPLHDAVYNCAGNLGTDDEETVSLDNMDCSISLRTQAEVGSNSC
jgi:hypothetical protein